MRISEQKGASPENQNGEQRKQKKTTQRVRVPMCTPVA